MSKAISVGELSDAVKDMLDKYRDDIADGTDKAAKKYARQCRDDIKTAAASTFGGSGKYANGWSTKQTESSRGHAQYTVYNKRPGLPHLLENGHAKVGGGRVAGRPHIAPAANKASEDFERAVRELIDDAGG